jgi:hypothetical protein
MRHNIGSIELSDEVNAQLRVLAELKGWSMRQLSAHALTLYIHANEAQIMNAVKLRAKKYGISAQETFNRLYAGQGFDGLKIVNPAPVLSEEERENPVNISLEDLELR